MVFASLVCRNTNCGGLEGFEQSQQAKQSKELAEAA